jgi:hypothetical protein
MALSQQLGKMKLFLYEVIESTKEKLVVKKHSEEIFILQRREETLELQINSLP